MYCIITCICSISTTHVLRIKVTFTIIRYSTTSLIIFLNFLLSVCLAIMTGCPRYHASQTDRNVCYHPYTSVISQSKSSTSVMWHSSALYINTLPYFRPVTVGAWTVECFRESNKPYLPYIKNCSSSLWDSTCL